MSWVPAKPLRPAEDRGNTVDSLTQVYRESQMVWDNSEQREENRAFFNRTILPLQSIRVLKRAVCLGIGSFCQANNYDEDDGPGLSWPRGLNTMTQFVAFEYWLSLLRTRTDIAEVAFQDPQFNDVDRAFLSARGYNTILTNAEQTITHQTFLFAPVGGFLEVIWNCLITKHPCLLISENIEPVYHRYNDDHTEILGPMTLKDFSGEPRTREIQRRRIVRPFQRTHVTRPLWRFSDATTIPSVPRDQYARFTPGYRPPPVGTTMPRDDRTQAEKFLDTGLADMQRRGLHPSLRWASEMFIYWFPDNRNRLLDPRNLKIEDDLPCNCWDCMKIRPITELGLWRERTPSPMDDDDAYYDSDDPIDDDHDDDGDGPIDDDQFDDEFEPPDGMDEAISRFDERRVRFDEERNTYIRDRTRGQRNTNRRPVTPSPPHSPTGRRFSPADPPSTLRISSRRQQFPLETRLFSPADPPSTLRFSSRRQHFPLETRLEQPMELNLGRFFARNPPRTVGGIAGLLDRFDLTFGMLFMGTAIVVWMKWLGVEDWACSVFMGFYIAWAQWLLRKNSPRRRAKGVIGSAT